MIGKNELLMIIGESKEDAISLIRTKLAESPFSFSIGQGMWDGVLETVFLIRLPIDLIEISRALDIAILSQQDAVCFVTHTGFGFTHMINELWTGQKSPKCGHGEFEDYLVDMLNGPCGKLRILPKVEAIKKPSWFAIGGIFFVIGDDNLANTPVLNK